MEPAIAAAFLAAIAAILAAIDNADLEQAVASRSVPLIESAALGGAVGALTLELAMRRELLRTAVAAGNGTAGILSDAFDIEFAFRAVDPNSVLFARLRAADLVRDITREIREALRIVVALGAQIGLTPAQQAGAIRQVVGLPSNWASAPTNLAQELRAGRFTSTRRLSAVDKAKIRSRLARGTVTEEFIGQMSDRYARSLLNRRALNIGRTESLRAAHGGQHEAWRQAIREGVLPETTRRAWIVTPDDRLRPEHAAIPGLNPDGVRLDEPFRTPLGPFVDPPIEPNCRCGVGLFFPETGGVL